MYVCLLYTSDIVLEVLRQDLDFYDFYCGYLYETMLSAITYQLGQNQLDVLMDFMQEPGYVSYTHLDVYKRQEFNKTHVFINVAIFSYFGIGHDSTGYCSCYLARHDSM